MTDKEKVYNVEHIDFKISEVDGVDFTEDDGESKLDPVEGISDDGFGITPEAETELIEGLKGEEGFSVDPSSAAEGSLTLKSTSQSLQSMIDLYNAQTTGETGPFEIRIEVSDDVGGEAGTSPRHAFGFSKMVVENAMLVSYAPFETDGRESPDYEFEFIGYDFEVKGPEED